MLHPRYWQQGLLAGVVFGFGVLLLVDGVRRAFPDEKRNQPDKR